MSLQYLLHTYVTVRSEMNDVKNDVNDADSLFWMCKAAVDVQGRSRFERSKWSMCTFVSFGSEA